LGFSSSEGDAESFIRRTWRQSEISSFPLLLLPVGSYYYSLYLAS
jgi:hypothetical protein